MEWETVKGFVDYEATKCGRIRRKGGIVAPKGMTPYFLKGKELSFSHDRYGYLKTALRKGGKRHHKTVHRIIAETFIPNTRNYPVVNHKNGIKDDNRVENLEWCSFSYNTRHSFRVLGRKGQNGGQNVPVIKIDPNTGQELGTYNSMTEAGKNVGVTNITISACINGRLKTAGGYRWIRASEGVSTIEKVE